MPIKILREDWWIFSTDINAKATKDCFYMTPLACASKFDAHEACRLLIQKGASVLQKTCNGQSPLHYAARKGHTRVLEVSHWQGRLQAVSNFGDSGEIHARAQIPPTFWHSPRLVDPISSRLVRPFWHPLPKNVCAEERVGIKRLVIEPTRVASPRNFAPRLCVFRSSHYHRHQS